MRPEDDARAADVAVELLRPRPAVVILEIGKKRDVRVAGELFDAEPGEVAEAAVGLRRHLRRRRPRHALLRPDEVEAAREAQEERPRERLLREEPDVEN